MPLTTPIPPTMPMQGRTRMPPSNNTNAGEDKNTTDNTDAVEDKTGENYTTLRISDENPCPLVNHPHFVVNLQHVFD